MYLQKINSIKYFKKIWIKKTFHTAENFLRMVCNTLFFVRALQNAL